ncbi:hypothetical protein [Streptomyces sp. TLI_146]|uniref:hypothetical protein n=1 Tax=Streptomyces sp. TLI_146 TaxID=1938858 RepID=UPI000C6FEEE3|nr:hypothetical protein [Streptomyces sp. TLI_146]PKV90153.1 hypothetical protein BX283_7834 [Streptomyces sp. TLI_146]
MTATIEAPTLPSLLRAGGTVEDLDALCQWLPSWTEGQGMQPLENPPQGSAPIWNGPDDRRRASKIQSTKMITVGRTLSSCPPLLGNDIDRVIDFWSGVPEGCLGGAQLHWRELWS